MTDTSQRHQAMPLGRTLGMEVVRARAGEVVLRMSSHEGCTTSGGAPHGGALMALADSAGRTCASLDLPPGAATSPISSSTSFLRGVRGGHVTATARPVHVGRTSIAFETELRDDDGRPVAKVS